MRIDVNTREVEADAADVLERLESAAAQVQPPAPGIVSTNAVAPQPAKPGKLTITANSVVCTVTGNDAPATALVIACTVGPVSFGYTVPLPPSTAYTFDHRYNADAVTCMARSDASGAITATASGQVGTAQSSTPAPVVF